MNEVGTHGAAGFARYLASFPLLPVSPNWRIRAQKVVVVMVVGVATSMCVRGWVGEGDACVCVCARMCVLCGYMAWVCGCSTEPQTTPVDLLLFAEIQ